jgi:hypothetical protein
MRVEHVNLCELFFPRVERPTSNWIQPDADSFQAHIFHPCILVSSTSSYSDRRKWFVLRLLAAALLLSVLPQRKLPCVRNLLPG